MMAWLSTILPRKYFVIICTKQFCSNICNKLFLSQFKFLHNVFKSPPPRWLMRLKGGIPERGVNKEKELLHFAAPCFFLLREPTCLPGALHPWLHCWRDSTSWAGPGAHSARSTVRGSSHAGVRPRPNSGQVMGAGQIFSQLPQLNYPVW